MSLCSEAVLDHIAEFLKFISHAQLLWFTLDTSYNHGCHLANQFRLTTARCYLLLPAWHIYQIWLPNEADGLE